MKKRTAGWKSFLLTLLALVWIFAIPVLAEEGGSGDNSLSTLGITTEGVTVSPDFVYSTIEYNVTVPAGTKRLELSPVTSNENAWGMKSSLRLSISTQGAYSRPSLEVRVGLRITPCNRAFGEKCTILGGRQTIGCLPRHNVNTVECVDTSGFPFWSYTTTPNGFKAMVLYLVRNTSPGS